MMPCSVVQRSLTLAVAISIVCTVPLFATETWFDQRVTWRYGTEGLEWKTVLRSPRGEGAYQLILRPLWAVEGGVVAMEIVIARPEQPDVNLLGDRQNGVESPFVITVEELQDGVAKSKFGAVRNLQVESILLRVGIESYRLGRGVGSGSTLCKSCKNIQELSMRISVETKTR